MGKKNDKKLCWSCEGKVDLNVDLCPYCGTSLNLASSGIKKSIPVFNAPYNVSIASEDPPPPPYSSFSHNSNSPESLPQEEMAPQKEKSFLEGKKEMLALILLLPGIVFFLFGMALLLFSQEGVFTLHWSQSFSYIYFLGALPLLYFGYKTLK